MSFSPHPLRVLFLASEADPFVKVGGLGDVAGSLPAALHALSTEPGEGQEIDIRLAIPFHGAIQNKTHSLNPLAFYAVPHSDGPIQATIYETESQGLPVYLIGGKFIPPDAPVYTNDPLLDGRKYIFFSLAALELPQALDWQFDLLHANDWHTSPAIYALNLQGSGNRRSARPATLLGVHNLPYLGAGAGPALQEFGLAPATGSPLPKWAQDLPLPLGLLTADHIAAVSPTYAKEILTPEFGSGLDAFLRSRADSISGILNGIDVSTWDPVSDPHLYVNYNQDQLEKRERNKASLQQELGIAVDPRVMLLGMVSRLDPQKGVDLVPQALRQLSELNWQAVILGTGVANLERELRNLEADFPGRVRAITRFDGPLSHRIYASSDALLIPSRYEPCGLAQMIAMRYGCVPVGRATGGLRDTIKDFFPENIAGSSGQVSTQSTGFLFEEATPRSLAGSLWRAHQVYRQPGLWNGIRRNGMQQDFSWRRSARQYLDLYRKLVFHKE